MSISARKLWRSTVNKPNETPLLPFDMTPLETLRSSPKKVFAHYFGQFPRSYYNDSPTNDYYSNIYLKPSLETWYEPDGTPHVYDHRPYGGLLRNRPMPRNPLAGDWRAADARWELQQAVEMGIDGFYCNIMQANAAGDHMVRYRQLATTASAEYPGFYILPMIDASSEVANQTPTLITDLIYWFYGKNTTYLVDNELLVGTFLMEGRPNTWWQTLSDTMVSRFGVRIKWVGVFNEWNKASEYTAYATGPWGPGANPQITASTTYGNDVRTARPGQLYQAAVWRQDVRPKSWIFTEAGNLESIRAGWQKAISEQAELIQLCTWNDYSEGSEFNMTPGTGRVVQDVSSYYLVKHKTGSFPTIRRDTIYLSHRDQMASSIKTTTHQTKWFSERTYAPGTYTPFREKIEALVFLTAPATVTITVAGVTSTFYAPAGVSAHLTDARFGTVSASVTRSGTVVAAVDSPVPIRETVHTEDRCYFTFGSLRGTAGQFNPNPTADGSMPPYPAL